MVTNISWEITERATCNLRVSKGQGATRDAENSIESGRDWPFTCHPEILPDSLNDACNLVLTFMHLVSIVPFDHEVND